MPAEILVNARKIAERVYVLIWVVVSANMNLCALLIRKAKRRGKFSESNNERN